MNGAEPRFQDAPDNSACLHGRDQLAAAQIQRLGFYNARLREALEASSNITHIGRPGSR